MGRKMMIDVSDTIVRSLIGGKNVTLFMRRYRQEFGTKRFLSFIHRVVLDNMVRGRFRRWLAKRRLGFSPNLQVTFTPLADCNLSCQGCYAADYKHSGQMDGETVSRIIAEARSIGICSFAILGGEPFLWKDLFKVLEDNPRTFFTIVSNGTLIDEAAVERIRQAGNAFPFVSLDGFQEHNDEWRGDGVFNKVIQAMNLFRSKGLPFGFVVTVTTKNFAEVTSAEFLDFLIDKGAYYGAYSPWGPAGRNPGFDYMLTLEQCQEIYKRIDKLEATRPLLFHKEGYNDATRLNRGCGAGRVVNILPDGSVEPCNAIHFSAGNVYESSLPELLQHPFYAALRKLADTEPEKRCIGLFRTRDVISCVESWAAVPTNPEAFCQLRAFAEHLVEGMLIHKRK
jgi:MoaA/NifB/PqqE/SkfB family radical SAM enzyme